MVSELDICRSAQVLVRQHQAAAPAEARRRAERFSAAGDAAGEAVWRRIASAAEQLLVTEPPAVDRRH